MYYNVWLCFLTGMRKIYERITLRGCCAKSAVLKVKFRYALLSAFWFSSVFCSFTFWSTVKPVYNDHPWDLQKVVVVQRVIEIWGKFCTRKDGQGRFRLVVSTGSTVNVFGPLHFLEIVFVCFHFEENVFGQEPHQPKLIPTNQNTKMRANVCLVCLSLME